jgi:hypothetical protein
MVAATLASWAVMALLVAPASRLPTFLGMAAPLGVAVATWLMTARVWRQNPQALTAVFMTAFGAKLVFFGAYMAVMLRGLSVDPVPFVASFAGYYITLHLAEALAFRVLFEGTSGFATPRE